MALIDGQDVQGGQGFTLVPLGHPGAAFEAVCGCQIFDTGFLRENPKITGFSRDLNLTNFGLEFFRPLMALIDGQDVQGGQDSTLVSPGHPEAAFEAIFGVV